MHFDLTELLTAIPNLKLLEEPFMKVEIDKAIKNLPTNKSPGPDGFNTDFLKHCWPIIAQDFYDLCHAFHSHVMTIGLSFY